MKAEEEGGEERKRGRRARARAAMAASVRGRERLGAARDHEGNRERLRLRNRGEKRSARHAWVVHRRLSVPSPPLPDPRAPVERGAHHRQRVAMW